MNTVKVCAGLFLIFAIFAETSCLIEETQEAISGIKQRMQALACKLHKANTKIFAHTHGEDPCAYENSTPNEGNNAAPESKKSNEWGLFNMFNKPQSTGNAGNNDPFNKPLGQGQPNFGGFPNVNNGANPNYGYPNANNYGIPNNFNFPNPTINPQYPINNGQYPFNNGPNPTNFPNQFNPYPNFGQPNQFPNMGPTQYPSNMQPPVGNNWPYPNTGNQFPNINQGGYGQPNPNNFGIPNSQNPNFGQQYPNTNQGNYWPGQGQYPNNQYPNFNTQRGNFGPGQDQNQNKPEIPKTNVNSNGQSSTTEKGILYTVSAPTTNLKPENAGQDQNQNKPEIPKTNENSNGQSSTTEKGILSSGPTPTTNLKPENATMSSSIVFPSNEIEPNYFSEMGGRRFLGNTTDNPTTGKSSSNRVTQGFVNQSTTPKSQSSTVSHELQRKKNNEDYSEETDDSSKKHEESEEETSQEHVTRAPIDGPIVEVEDGKRILSNVKANCPDGWIADKKGICREKY